MWRNNRLPCDEHCWHREPPLGPSIAIIVKGNSSSSILGLPAVHFAVGQEVCAVPLFGQQKPSSE